MVAEAVEVVIPLIEAIELEAVFKPEAIDVEAEVIESVGEDAVAVTEVAPLTVGTAFTGDRISN